MMKPLLVVSAFALAAPALAQDMTTDDMGKPPATTTTTPQTPEMAPPVEPTDDAATTATPSEAAEAQANVDEAEDSMTTTTTESMSDATTTQATDMDATADQTGVTTEATAATTATTPAVAAPTMPAGTAMGGPSNWAEFDGDSDGNLTPLEFGKLVMDSKGQPVGAEVDATLRSRESNLPSVQVLNSTSVELARVDTDRNWMVSQAELHAYQPE